MDLLIRNFERCSSDYEAVARILSEALPHMPTTADELKFDDDNFSPQYSWTRFLAELNGAIIAYSEFKDPYWSYEPGKLHIELFVAPKLQNRGIGTQVYEHLAAEIEPLKPKKLVTEIHENEIAMRFLSARGFTQTMRFPTSELDLPNFDTNKFQHVFDRVAAENIEILSITELPERDPDWKLNLYNLRWEILADVPSPDPLTRDSLDDWNNKVLNNPRIFKESWMVALDGEQYVGYSNLWKVPAKPDKLDTGLTGVVRSHRRKGICTAMKIKAFDAAKALGVSIIETENEENNPMYQINMKLGFEPRPAWVAFEKVLA